MGIFSDKSALMSRASDWDIHTGDAYAKSSASGRAILTTEKAHDSRWNYDTSHDIRRVTDFWDFMNARALQADNLVEDLRAYQAFSEKHMSVTGLEPQMPDLIRNYSERAVMALYGIDMSRHGKEFADFERLTGERALPVEAPFMRRSVARGSARYELSDSMTSGDINALISELETFSDNWAMIAAREEKGMAFAQKNHTQGLALVGPIGETPRGRIMSQDFLNRYVAENEGRSEYFRRMTYASKIPWVDTGVKVRATGDLSYPQYNSVKVNKIFDICENQHNELGFGPGAAGHAMDGASIVRLAVIGDQPQAEIGYPNRDMKELNKSKQHSDAIAARKFNVRSMTDLDAAFANVMPDERENEGLDPDIIV